MSAYRLLLALPCLMAACTTTHQQPPLAEAVTTPLSDLNLVRTRVPAVLVEARDRPYRLPIRSDCADLHGELRALDEALGPDLDAPPLSEGPQERLGRAAGRAAVQAMRRSAEDVLPMRGWVRKLSGAERREEQVNAALKAGTARRAFIKGMLYAHDCVTAGMPAETMPGNMRTATAVPDTTTGPAEAATVGPEDHATVQRGRN